MFISKLWVEIFWCILFGVTGVMFLWGMVTDACRWTATPVCRGTLTTVKGLKWVKVTIEVWSFASKVRKVGGDLQNLHIWGNLCEFWIWIWRKGFFDNGIVREWRKKRRFCAVAINVSEDEVQFLLAIQFTEKTVFQPRVLDRMLGRSLSESRGKIGL